MNTPISLLESFIVNREEQKKGVYFLDKHLEIKSFYSYSEIFQKALSIQNQLKILGISPGEPVLLVYDQGPDFLAAILGCFMARVIAVPCYPPFTKAMISRFVNIIKTVQPKYVFVDSTTHQIIRLSKIFNFDLIKKVANWVMQKKSLASLDGASFKFQIVETDEILDQSLEFKDFIFPKSEDTAFIQYTSGSIGQPKGVIIKHKNLNHNLHSIKTSTDVNTNSKIFSWLPQYHDMGLVGCLLMAVYTGCDLYFTSPLNFIKSPALWLKGITKFQITHTAAPNFAYDLVLRKMTQEDREQLDLSSLVAVVNAAEPIKHQTLLKFVEDFKFAKFDGKAFALCYGLAEATLMVSINRGEDFSKTFCPESLKNNRAVEKNDLEGVFLVNCGSAIPEHDIRIIDPLSNDLLPDGHIGEICISGHSIFDGYWGISNESHGSLSDRIDEYFKTGDLGFLINNHLFVTGRSKDLIIKNGLNFYPQDIERIIEENCSFVKKGRSVAFSLTQNEEEFVALVFEYANGQKQKDISEHSIEIAKKVLEFLGLKLDLVVVLHPNSIQKTTSGKLQRQLMKQMYQTKKLKVISEARL